MPLIHDGCRTDRSQPEDQAMLGAAASDGPGERAAAPRVLVVLECLGGQEGRGHLNSSRAHKAADSQSEADRPRGTGGPSEFADERESFRGGSKV